MVDPADRADADVTALGQDGDNELPDKAAAPLEVALVQNRPVRSTPEMLVLDARFG